ncbi:hypothetical protein QQZ08_010781 [Neonectria magnoliae]|uniref:Fungal N-terminal domain-containing protein n=1 Tax=Neonectria magnoliae TaxID=2732573 RepID=A0ABR1HET7_9HYPO
MDPLSVTASIIALVQATAAIGKGVHFLRSLGHIPDEFCYLTNELSTLQAVLGQVTSALQELQSEKPNALVPNAEMAAIRGWVSIPELCVAAVSFSTVAGGATEWLQKSLANKALHPTDIDDSGQSLLLNK